MGCSLIHVKFQGYQNAYIERGLILLSFLFQGLSKNLEQPEVKEWLAMTKDTLMGDKPGKDQDEEAKKLNEILAR